MGTITETTTPDYQIRPSRIWHTGTIEPSNVLVSLRKDRKYKDSYRPKVLPLYLHPTILPRQHTFYYQSMVKKYVGSNYDSYIYEMPLYTLKTCEDLSTMFPTTLDLDTALAFKAMKGLNLANYVGEYKETLGLFVLVGKLLYDVWLLAHGRKPKYFKSLIKSLRNGRTWNESSLAGAWITNSFAISPVLADLGTALLLLEGSINAAPLKRRVKVTSKSNFESNVNDTSYERRYTGELSERNHLYVTFDPATLDGYTWGNVAEMVWEGIPFSFVVDWWYGVGSVLTSLDAFRGINFVVGTKTIRSKSHATIKVAEGTPYQHHKKGSLTCRSFSRALVSEFPGIQLPTYKRHDSVNLVVTQISLLTLLLSKK